MTGAASSSERLATLQAVTETETPYGGRVEAWADVATVWVVLRLSAATQATGADQPPSSSQGATAVARDHPFAAAGQQLVVSGDPTPFRVRELRRADPGPGRMTLVLDRLL